MLKTAPAVTMRGQIRNNRMGEGITTAASQTSDEQGEAAFDIFVSYAHADDEVPTGAQRGWVTTLVGELKKVLRRKLGGEGASVWIVARRLI